MTTSASGRDAIRRHVEGLLARASGPNAEFSTAVLEVAGGGYAQFAWNDGSPARLWVEVHDPGGHRVPFEQRGWLPGQPNQHRVWDDPDANARAEAADAIADVLMLLGARGIADVTTDEF